MNLVLDPELQELIAKCIADRVKVNGKWMSRQAFTCEILRSELKRLAAIIDGTDQL
jgi:hypothetical protein